MKNKLGENVVKFVQDLLTVERNRSDDMHMMPRRIKEKPYPIIQSI
jgi:hypothetical protein